MIRDQETSPQRKTNEFKKLYLENCIQENVFPHQAIMKKLRMADENFDTLEHLELDSSTIRDVDLNPLISTIQSTDYVRTLNLSSIPLQDPKRIIKKLQSAKSLDKIKFGTPNRKLLDASVSSIQSNSQVPSTRNRYDYLHSELENSSPIKRDRSLGSGLETNRSFKPTKPKEEPGRHTPVARGKYMNMRPRGTHRELSEPMSDRKSAPYDIQLIKEQIQTSINMLKVAINEAPDSPQRKRTKKVMSRIEWIMQLKNVFSTLITTFNQEYFKKEIITNMIQGREPEYPLLLEEVYYETHLDNGYSIREVIQAIQDSPLEVLHYDDVVEVISRIARKDASSYSAGLPKPKLKELQLDLTKLPNYRKAAGSRMSSDGQSAPNYRKTIDALNDRRSADLQSSPNYRKTADPQYAPSSYVKAYHPQSKSKSKSKSKRAERIMHSDSKGPGSPTGSEDVIDYSFSREEPNPALSNSHRRSASLAADSPRGKYDSDIARRLEMIVYGEQLPSNEPLLYASHPGLKHSASTPIINRHTESFGYDPRTDTARFKGNNRTTSGGSVTHFNRLSGGLESYRGSMDSRGGSVNSRGGSVDSGKASSHDTENTSSLAQSTTRKVSKATSPIKEFQRSPTIKGSPQELLTAQEANLLHVRKSSFANPANSISLYPQTSAISELPKEELFNNRQKSYENSLSQSQISKSSARGADQFLGPTELLSVSSRLSPLSASPNKSRVSSKGNSPARNSPRGGADTLSQSDRLKRSAILSGTPGKASLYDRASVEFVHMDSPRSPINAARGSASSEAHITERLTSHPSNSGTKLTPKRNQAGVHVPTFSSKKEESLNDSAQRSYSPAGSERKESSPSTTRQKDTSPANSVRKEYLPSTPAQKVASPAGSTGKTSSPSPSLHSQRVASPAGSVKNQPSPANSARKATSYLGSIHQRLTAQSANKNNNSSNNNEEEIYEEDQMEGGLIQKVGSEAGKMSHYEESRDQSMISDRSKSEQAPSYRSATEKQLAGQNYHLLQGHGLESTRLDTRSGRLDTEGSQNYTGDSFNLLSSNRTPITARSQQQQQQQGASVQSSSQNTYFHDYLSDQQQTKNPSAGANTRKSEKGERLSEHNVASQNKNIEEEEEDSNQVDGEGNYEGDEKQEYVDVRDEEDYLERADEDQYGAARHQYDNVNQPIEEEVYGEEEEAAYKHSGPTVKREVYSERKSNSRPEKHGHHTHALSSINMVDTSGFELNERTGLSVETHSTFNTRKVSAPTYSLGGRSDLDYSRTGVRTKNFSYDANAKDLRDDNTSTRPADSKFATPNGRNLSLASISVSENNNFSGNNLRFAKRQSGNIKSFATTEGSTQSEGQFYQHHIVRSYPEGEEQNSGFQSPPSRDLTVLGKKSKSLLIGSRSESNAHKLSPIPTNGSMICIETNSPNISGLPSAIKRSNYSARQSSFSGKQFYGKGNSSASTEILGKDIQSKIRRLERVIRSSQDGASLAKKIKDSYAPTYVKSNIQCSTMSLSYIDEAQYKDAINNNLLAEIVEEVQVLRLTDSIISTETLHRILHIDILVLNLSNNNLKSSSFLNEVPNLLFLNVSNNELKELDALSQCTQLEEAVFSHNRISRLPNMTRVKNLALIDASFNDIHSYENLANLTQNTKLRVFNLSHNPITRKMNYKSVLKNILHQVLAFDIFDIDLSDFKDLEDICFNSLQRPSHNHFPRGFRSSPSQPDISINMQGYSKSNSSQSFRRKAEKTVSFQQEVSSPQLYTFGQNESPDVARVLNSSSSMKRSMSHLSHLHSPSDNASKTLNFTISSNDSRMSTNKSVLVSKSPVQHPHECSDKSKVKVIKANLYKNKSSSKLMLTTISSFYDKSLLDESRYSTKSVRVNDISSYNLQNQNTMKANRSSSNLTTATKRK